MTIVRMTYDLFCSVSLGTFSEPYCTNGAINNAYVLLFLLPAIPTAKYIFIDRTEKRSAIIASFKSKKKGGAQDAAQPLVAEAPDSIIRYFQLFQPQQSLRDPNKWEASLRSIYEQHNGWKLHFVAWLLLLAANAVFLWMCRQSVIEWIAGQSINGGRYPLAVVTAIAGGYMFGTYDMLLRTSNRYLLPRHLYEAAFRIMVAVPMGYSLSQFANPSLAVPLSFSLGAFPTGTLFTMIRRIVPDKLSSNVAEELKSSALLKLPTVSQISAESLYDVGIGNISQLALEDPVILSIRTGLPFIYVTDCTCQALLQKYFGEYAVTAHKVGLQGSCECKNLFNDLKSEDEAVKTIANATVKVLCDAMSLPKEAVENLLSEIAMDPLTEFYAQWWNESAN